MRKLSMCLGIHETVLLFHYACNLHRNVGEERLLRLHLSVVFEEELVDVVGLLEVEEGLVTHVFTRLLSLAQEKLSEVHEQLRRPHVILTQALNTYHDR